MRRIFLVAFKVPKGATVEDMEEYVEAAVKSFCGGIDPMEPMFHLDKKTVLVQTVKKTLLW